MNENFYSYYKDHLNLSLTDFNLFIDSIKSPLPYTFRVTQCFLKDKIKNKLKDFNFVQRVPYLQDVFTFSSEIQKNKSNLPFLAFLRSHTQLGNIQRQEVVSIFPHLFLDIKEDDLVFEPCAAPGSKTKQILEKIKNGILISNDKSPKRANVLITEGNKKPNKNFIITEMNAINYPRVNLIKKNKVVKHFDKICCDVPCSSDGTIKKT